MTSTVISTKKFTLNAGAGKSSELKLEIETDSENIELFLENGLNGAGDYLRDASRIAHQYKVTPVTEILDELECEYQNGNKKKTLELLEKLNVVLRRT